MRSFKGVVQKGAKRAAALGYPTVNIPLDERNASGIYAARVLFEGTEHPAAAFADQKRKVLEAHMLDANLDLYGKEITIELLKKIRDNESFDDDAALCAAIASDVAAIREYFSKV